MRRLPILVTSLLLAAIFGCSRQEVAKAPEAAKPAAVEAKPAGQEAGLCKEHGVLESICTKCNPKLAPIFQAKGDWCAEHGFPESVCPICHPERGGKPAMDVAGDDAPADGTKVILKGRETARLAGIETTKAVAGRGSAEIVAPVVISYDPARVALVTARASGVARQVTAEVGHLVHAGSTLAIIESSAVSGDQSRLVAARSRISTLEENYRRTAELEQKGIVARKELLAARQEVRDATAEMEALQASLHGVGAGSGSGGRYAVKAPVSGVITQRTVSPGRMVDAQTALFEIVDTSSMWAEIAVPEAELATVRAGLKVVITVDGLSGREYRGTIASIATLLDPQSRTARARVKLANPGGLLRANMYGQARIAAGRTHASAAVPRDAIQRARSVKLAFVKLGANEFEARRVQLASDHGSGEMVEIASGVEVGEEVVVAGSFLLKTETLKESIGAGCCEVDTK